MSRQKIYIHSSRRRFIAFLLAGGAAGLSPSIFLRYAHGLGLFELPSGMHRVEGEVQVNGIGALPGSPVNSGDVITTGAASLAIFVVGKDVYLLRENSRLHLAIGADTSLNTKVAEVLRITAGQLLAVFGKGEKRLELPTATVGIRGTGVYAEPGARRSYYCNCYGTAEIVSSADPAEKLTLQTRYHESPVHIYASRTESGTGKYIKAATVFNHSDAELIMLESIVFRSPPFSDKNGHEGRGY